jgi:hypothetical protein
MRYYLQRAYLVLITDSKFFTGPPFSGALLVSEQTRARIQPVFGVPQGLTDYTTHHDWPESWNWMRDQLADRTNVGLSLRWVAALEDIRAYFAVPTLFRKLALTEFSAAAVRTISCCPALQLLAQPQDSLANVSDEDEIASCSIFPFTVIRDGHSRMLKLKHYITHSAKMFPTFFLRTTVRPRSPRPPVTLVSQLPLALDVEK